MSNRRTDQRLQVGGAIAGSLRVARDVRICQEKDGHYVVLSSAPGIVGEVLTLDLLAPETSVAVRVAASRPVMVDGAVRHEIHLAADARGEATPVIRLASSVPDGVHG